MNRDKLRFLFLNVGHFLDHFFMLIFASVAALRLSTEWEMSYAELIPYATPGFAAFGVCALIAGWLADKWSREGMMVIFFMGIGASSIFAGLAENPFQIAVSLTLIGIFASIYHPVGLAMVVQGRVKTGIPLAINGIYGNMGVASAALLTGFLIDTTGWRNAFVVPGIVAIVLGITYLLFNRSDRHSDVGKQKVERTQTGISSIPKHTVIRIFGIVIITTALGGLIFQSTTFSLPKVFDERISDIAVTATMVGWYSFLVFSVAAIGQLVVGFLVDNHSIRTVFAVVALFQAVFLTVMIPLTGIPALIVALAFMLVVFGQIPINDALVGRFARSEWRSRAYAMRYIVTFSVMALTVPLIAWIHGTWGFSTLFGLLGVTASLIFVAVLILPKSEQIAQRHATSAE